MTAGFGGAAIRGARRAIKKVLHPAIAPLLIRAFRARAEACSGWPEALRLAERFEYARVRIAPVQVRAEIAAFLEMMEAYAPKVVLEIGTANGGTLFLYSRVAAPEALLVSVDLPGGEFGGGYPRWKERLYRSFARPGQTVSLLRADSHDPETAARIARLLDGRAVDFLFIDGDHSYEGVRADYETYAPLVRVGGVVAFHDIVPGPEEAVGGVPTFWKELKPAVDGREIVADWKQGGYGIGWFAVESHATSPAGEQRSEDVACLPNTASSS